MRKEKGIPLLQWMDDDVSDLRNIGIKIWRTRALDRTKWESVTNEAKAKLKGS
jgi:hypothetical protein